jgi:hypothetical protein
MEFKADSAPRVLRPPLLRPHVLGPHVLRRHAETSWSPAVWNVRSVERPDRRRRPDGRWWNGSRWNHCRRDRLQRRPQLRTLHSRIVLVGFRGRRIVSELAGAEKRIELAFGNGHDHLRSMVANDFFGNEPSGGCQNAEMACPPHENKMDQ